MRILSVHNYYQHPGGEDTVFEPEAALLERHGHHVIRHTVHNAAVATMRHRPARYGRSGETRSGV
jgi:hypothetical protein